MIMTDLAVRDLQERRESIVDRCRSLLGAVFGRTSDHQLPSLVAERQATTLRAVPAAKLAPQPRMRVVTTNQHHDGETNGADMRWQRHPQLRSRQVEPAAIPGSERAARLAAERGVILARGGKLLEAVDAFTTAARDESVDLGALPGFWDLPRNGMLTAVRAYERVDRLRDASALEARIRNVLRPRALKPVPSAPQPGRMTASGD
jgi:hypothetical protein